MPSVVFKPIQRNFDLYLHAMNDAFRNINTKNYNDVLNNVVLTRVTRQDQSNVIKTKLTKDGIRQNSIYEGVDLRTRDEIIENHVTSEILAFYLKTLLGFDFSETFFTDNLDVSDVLLKPDVWSALVKLIQTGSILHLANITNVLNTETVVL